ncbi:MAG: FKBP-type peptidyl-prolyl cis-trans isomerase [Planctomycetota bacterium]
MKRSKRILAALAVITGRVPGGGPNPQGGATESTIPADTEIHTTESGLQYSVLTPGNGQEFPAFGDVVEVHYTGWLTDGTKFDSSRDRGEPTQFPLGNVIEGWNEGLLLMSPGARFKDSPSPRTSPTAKQAAPPVIPKNATLIFDVELLRIPERALPYVDWNRKAPTAIDGGLKYQVLKAGEGTPAGEAKYVFLEFARYGADKKITLASTMTGMIVGPPSHPKAALPGAAAEGHAGRHPLPLVQVPKALDLQMPGAGDAESTLWRRLSSRAR